MSQINPKKIIEDGILIPHFDTAVQTNGIDLSIAQDVVLRPKEFINIEVQEKFNMKDCFGIIIIRSSLSRKGVFCSSGLYDTGYKNIGGLSLYNLGEEVITLQKGTRVAQMVFFKAEPAELYKGHYNQVDNINSKLDKFGLENPIVKKK